MVLHVDSDATYLVLPVAQSQLAGDFFLSTDPGLTHTVLATLVVEGQGCSTEFQGVLGKGCQQLG